MRMNKHMIKMTTFFKLLTGTFLIVMKKIVKQVNLIIEWILYIGLLLLRKAGKTVLKSAIKSANKFITSPRHKYIIIGIIKLGCFFLNPINVKSGIRRPQTSDQLRRC